MSILNFPQLVFNKSYLAISLLGVSYKLNVKYSNTLSIELIKKDNEIDLLLPKKYKNYDNSDIINLAIKKLYDDTAKEELEASLELARHILRFAPEDYRIERLKNSYYKCTRKTLIISPDIVQFNKDIINTTIIHAFCKVKFKANSVAYNTALESALENYNLHKNSSSTRKNKLKVS